MVLGVENEDLNHISIAALHANKNNGNLLKEKQQQPFIKVV